MQTVQNKAIFWLQCVRRGIANHGGERAGNLGVSRRYKFDSTVTTMMSYHKGDSCKAQTTADTMESYLVLGGNRKPNVHQIVMQMDSRAGLTRLATKPGRPLSPPQTASPTGTGNHQLSPLDRSIKTNRVCSPSSVVAMDPALVSLTLTTLACFQKYREYKKTKKSRKRLWMKPWLQKKDRSVYHKLIEETRVADGSVFYDFHRMNRQNFDVLLNLVAPLIQKETTQLRDTISAPERLSLTLRYLATGETRRSLGFQYRISHSLITYIIPEVCSAIYSVLKDMYLKLPSTSEEWKQVASDFYSSWNFPMCIGAMDGKRFLMRKPENTGSEYCDYKSRHSMIMLALVDAHYKFMYVDVGAQGRSSDAGVWDRCKLREYLEKEKLQVPPPDTLPFSDQKVPYVIVGDDAFPLKNYLMNLILART
ncbi:uncharacterized protein LOC134778434 [Penaeus indicus]|uniref:uncharacterized protein LOC134778434 n=1 Tax=Penaeus indicus TaxID=29960 RepID=UPI00300BFAF5